MVIVLDTIGFEFLGSDNLMRKRTYVSTSRFMGNGIVDQVIVAIIYEGCNQDSLMINTGTVIIMITIFILLKVLFTY